MFKKNTFDFTKICHILNTITKMDVRFIDQDGNVILQMVDHYIPTVLQNSNDTYHTINHILQNNQTNTYYYYSNSYGLEYIASGVWNHHSFKGSIVIGPFISSISVIEFMSDIIATNNLPISGRKQLESFYKALPVITSNEYEAIGECLVNMCHYEYIQPQLITADIIKPTMNKEELKNSMDESIHIIERRYELEKRLISAITKGDKSGVAQLSKESAAILDFSNRIPGSPIRSAKNISLVLNTLCRSAAEKGGVHPVYIHHISERFAILIERAPNLNQLNSLGMLMMNEYCEAVNVFSTRGYSPIVKKAIDYIQFNLENLLLLNNIATAIHVNPTYLSRKFKEDTNMTIIEYINHKRVEEAKLYLHRGNKSITEIAFLVGFNDLNYFSRVFKKITSVTPSQYSKSNYTHNENSD
ncbi:helix-turn-helix domain-containing protein [Bacillus sp. V3B]|uniref:helix-turn-helix domain-containing protein n=1 Tax=Bacillus sp. V3B TaxID=2804915 RepID=UPI00210AAF64|nr:helix-turn-helix domain-containing protein [Bacillus sp. V3B]MCQ6275648.1 helix-turn-helix domain-containing protein [Bacillus sp. V3B]